MSLKNILQIGSNEVEEKLQRIMNKSIISIEFPDVCKTSVVAPVQEISSTKQRHEFRPINMVPLREKFLELFIKQQLLDRIN